MIERSQDINELAAALAVAQGTIEHAAKDSANPFFKSKYADLASVWEAIRAPLADNGLSVLQLPSAAGPAVTITTILAHKSGQWVESSLTVTAKDETPQAVGSAITYARRYSLQSIVGVAPDDDDGEAAQGRPAPTAKVQRELGNQAAQAVAERKIAELKQTANPVQFDPQEQKFAEIKNIIGPVAFHRILGANGFERSADISSKERARAIYRELQQEAKDQADKKAVV